MNTLYDLAKQRVLILDGAMGTMIGKVLGKTGNSDELNLTRPEIITDIHRKYLIAGADIITTNTGGCPTGSPMCRRIQYTRQAPLCGWLYRSYQQDVLYVARCQQPRLA